MSELSRQDTPPRPGPRYPILRVKATTPTRYVLCGRAIYGLWTHWIKDRSIPCTEPRSRCPGCLSSSPHRRWKGYVHARCMANGEEGFIELTPFGACQLREQAGVSACLRGLQVKLSRGNGVKTRMKVELVYALPSSEGQELPEEKSPEITLFDLWQGSGFRLRRPEEEDLDQDALSA